MAVGATEICGTAPQEKGGLMENFENETVIVNASQYRSIMKLQTVEEQRDAFRLLILQGLEGRRQESGNISIDILLEMAIGAQISAKQRYERSVMNGAKGGRKSTVDRNQVLDLKDRGYTRKQIADELECSERTVSRIFSMDDAPREPEEAPLPKAEPLPDDDYDDDTPF